MKPKHLYLILALLALGGLLYAPTLLRSPEGRPPAQEILSFPSRGESPPTLVRVSRAGDGDTVRLERGEAGWLVNGHPADSARVAELLAALDTMAAGEVVARNPRNHPRLGVDEAGGRRVEIRGPDGESLAFILGGRDPAADAHYVREPDSPEVYLLPGPVGAYLARSAEAWRDRTIAAVDTSRVREILIRRGEEELVLRRDGERWMVGRAAADSATVASLLWRLASLSATGFPSDSAAEAADFERPDGILSVFAEEEGDVTGRALALSLRFLRGEEELDPWLVRRADERTVYQLSDFTARQLLPTGEELGRRRARE